MEGSNSIDWEEQDREDARANAERSAENEAVFQINIPGIKDDAVAVIFHDSWDAPRILIQRESDSRIGVVNAEICDLSGVTVAEVAKRFPEARISDGTREDEQVVVKYNEHVDNVCIDGIAEGCVAIDYDSDDGPRLKVHTTPSAQEPEYIVSLAEE